MNKRRRRFIRERVKDNLVGLELRQQCREQRRKELRKRYAPRGLKSPEPSSETSSKPK
jgi:hypothetical protein